MSSPRHLPPPPPVIAIAGWILPGAGYWLLGQRARALVVGGTISVLFVVGVLIGGVRVVDPPDLTGPGTFLHRVLAPSFVMTRIVQKPWFIGQVLTGPLAIVAAWGSSAAAASKQYSDMISHARIWEIGTLYTAVAGMLNLLAIIDASYRSAQIDPAATPTA